MSKSVANPTHQSEYSDADFMRELVRQLHRENRIERRWAIGIRLIRAFAFVAIAAAVLIAANRPALLPWGHQEDIQEHSAVLYIKGELSPETSASAQKLIPAIKRAFGHAKSRAVILRINSTGGSAVQAGLIYDEIVAQRSMHPDKPVYAVIEDVGASGGYYIAAAANKIFANRASLVGSIGVISSGFGFTELLEKLGIERRTITAGQNKGFLDPFMPLTADTKKFWQDVLGQTHKQFIDRVKQSRGKRLVQDDEDLFSGLIWNGEQAKDLGLIDDLLSVDAIARDVVGLSETIDYTPKADFLSRIAGKATLQAMQLTSHPQGVRFEHRFSH